MHVVNEERVVTKKLNQLSPSDRGFTVFYHPASLSLGGAADSGYHGASMKPHPPPHVSGNTDAERMSNALRMALTV